MKLFWLVLVCCAAQHYYVAHPDRVSLSEVQSLLFQKNKFTTGRRNPAIPQLVCVGGDCDKEHLVDQVFCENKGGDGFNYNWKCGLESKEARFKRFDVVCEGYHDSQDPYILRGSCGLEYVLEYVLRIPSNIPSNIPLNIPIPINIQPQPKSDQSGNSWLSILLGLMLLAAICCFIYYSCVSASSGPSEHEADYRGPDYRGPRSYESRSYESRKSNAESTITRATARFAPPAPPHNPAFVSAPQVVVIEKREVGQGMTLGDALVLNSLTRPSVEHHYHSPPYVPTSSPSPTKPSIIRSLSSSFSGRSQSNVSYGGTKRR